MVYLGTYQAIDCLANHCYTVLILYHLDTFRDEKENLPVRSLLKYELIKRTLVLVLLRFDVMWSCCTIPVPGTALWCGLMILIIYCNKVKEKGGGEKYRICVC